MNKIFFVLIILSFLNLFSTSASALTWKHALSMADANNYEIVSSRMQYQSAKWKYLREYSNFLPQLSADLSMNNAFTPTSNRKTYSYGLNVTQYLFKGMENYYSFKSAHNDKEYYKANMRKIKSDVYYKLRQAFIDVLVYQKDIKLISKILYRRRENTRMLQLRYDSGREDIGNLKLTRATQIESEYDLSSVKRKLKLSLFKISQIINHSVLFVVDSKSAKIAKKVNFDYLLDNSPGFRMNKHQLRSAEIAKRSTISKFLPSVSMSGRYKRTGNAWPPNITNRNWSLNVSYSFFPGGSNIADKKIYSFELDKAEKDFDNLKNDLRYNIEDSYRAFKDSLEALKVRKIYLDASSTRATIARAKYMNGLMSYYEWNRIENEYISSQKSLLNSQKSLLSAEAVWYNSHGGWVK